MRVPVAEPTRLRDALAASCGLIGRVRKRRVVYLVGRTRVHLDCVDGLGDFLELEVVLSDPTAQRAAMALTMERLGRGGEAPGLRAARSVLGALRR